MAFMTSRRGGEGPQALGTARAPGPDPFAQGPQPGLPPPAPSCGAGAALAQQTPSPEAALALFGHLCEPDPKAAEAAAAQLFRAMDGVGTDEDAIHAALRGKSQAELGAITRVFQDHYGRNLGGELLDELSGSDWSAAYAALSGDAVEASAAALENAADGIGTDEAAIRRTLESVTDPEQRAAVAAAFERRTGRTLASMLRSELSGVDLAVAESLSAGDLAGARAARVQDAMSGGFLRLGVGTDEETLYEVLETCESQAERDALCVAYRSRTGRDLATDLDDEVDGAERDLAAALLAGDQGRAGAARLHIAADGWGTDEHAIFAVLEGKSGAERDEILRAYGPGCAAMLADELDGLDGERARALAADGRLDPALALRCALDGAGTDEELIKATLAGRSKEEIEDLRAEYRARYGADLDGDLRAESSGRDGFQIGQLMLGEAQTPAEKLARANAAYDFERGSGAGLIGNIMTDLFSHSGEVLDAQHQKLQALEAKLLDGSATPEDLARIDTLADYQADDVKNVQAARDSITNGVAMGATAVVGTAVTILTAGGASPAVAAALAALASGGAGMLVKAGMQGSSYANEDILLDAATTLVNAVSAGVLQSAAAARALDGLMALAQGASPIVRSMIVSALRGGASGLVNGAVGGLLDEGTWRGPGSGARHFLERVGDGALAGAVAGAGAGAGQRVAPGSWLAWPDRAVAVGAARGALGGAAGSIAGTAVRSGTWNGRWEDTAGRFGQGAVIAALQGAIDGGLEPRRRILENARVLAKLEASLRKASDRKVAELAARDDVRLGDSLLEAMTLGGEVVGYHRDAMLKVLLAKHPEFASLPEFHGFLARLESMWNGRGTFASAAQASGSPELQELASMRNPAEFLRVGDAEALANPALQENILSQVDLMSLDAETLQRPEAAFVRDAYYQKVRHVLSGPGGYYLLNDPRTRGAMATDPDRAAAILEDNASAYAWLDRKRQREVDAQFPTMRAAHAELSEELAGLGMAGVAGRVAPATVRELMGNRTSSADGDERPLAVVINPPKHGDWNGAFKHNDIDELISHYRVLYYEPGSVKNLATDMSEATTEHAAQLLMLGGHGEQKHVLLGSDWFPRTLGLRDEGMLSRSGFGDWIEPGGNIVLQSCSTGKGKEGADNIANMLGRLAPHATIHAPTVPTNEELVLHPDGSFEDVKYYKGEKYTIPAGKQP